MPDSPPPPSPSAPIFLFAGGGSGGHIYPALAIAEQLLARAPHASCRFLCSSRAIDHDILSAESLGTPPQPVRFHPLPAQPFGLRPRPLLRFLNSWGAAVRAARALIREAKAQASPAPQLHLITTGGFVAAPAAQAARAEHIPLTLVNLDAVPGRANRWIARHSDRIFSSAPLAKPNPRWSVVPPIVRANALAPKSQPDCRRALGLHPDRPTLLITGASQGAVSINRFLIRFVEAHAPALRNWQLIHQTGKTDTDDVRSAYLRAGLSAVVQPFFHEMGLCWGAADAAVSRAGAGSVAEAWCNRTPTLFLPYPYHRDQHQKFNAEPLLAAHAALLADDTIDPAANLASLGPILLQLLQDDPARERLRLALTTLGPTDGAARIAAQLLAAS